MSSKINLYDFKILLTKKQQYKFYLFVLLSLISMVLEILGISLIFNVLQIISNNDLNKTFFFKFLNIETFNKINFFFIILASIVVIFTIKNIFLVYFEYQKYKFLREIKTTLGTKLFHLYLGKPFIFHLKNNSSILIRNINDINILIMMIRSLIHLIVEFTVLLGILFFLMYVEFIGTISTILFLIFFAFIFYRNIQKKTEILGKQRQFFDGKKLQHLIQGFSSIKDIIILQKRNFFVNIFSTNNQNSAVAEANHSFLLALPRLILEWLIVFGMLVLTVTIFLQKNELNSIIPTLGVFAAAAFRLMPSVTRIMNGLQSFKFAWPVAITVRSEIKEREKDLITHQNQKISKKFSFKSNIELKNINFQFEGSNKKVLNDINIKINYGDKVGIVGESGSGKTTLINLIMGLLDVGSGQLLIDRENLSKIKNNWQSQIGYVPQNVYLSDDSIKNNIAYGENEEDINIKKIENISKKTQLKKLISELPEGIQTKVGELGERLSAGERQRIGIARALYNGPKVLIFDEFTSSLDIDTERRILDELDIFEKERTIIIISHRMSTLSKCEKIFQLTNKGLKQIK